MRALLPSLLAAAALLSTATLSPAADGEKAAAPSDTIKAGLLGYWAIDVEKTAAGMKKDAEDGKNVPEFAHEMVKEMANQLIINFKKKKVVAHMAEGEEPATYKIVKADAEAGTFTLKVKEEDDNPSEETASCHLKGDALREWHRYGRYFPQ